MDVRSDSVDVEQIMRQIRARIREKRGADYTEAELQQLASVKLQQFLDPRGVRSDLVQEFRRTQPPAEALPNYSFEDTTLFETHRGLLRTIRRLLHPVLKLFFNPNKLSDALHIQSAVNEAVGRRVSQLERLGPLSYEVMHNLVIEVTRLGIQVQNLQMRVESLTNRLDFDERRARALETVVEYKPALARRADGPQPAAGRPAGERPAGERPPGGRPAGEDAGDSERRRRRRRRRRRPGQTAAETGGPGGQTVGENGPAGATSAGGQNAAGDAPRTEAGGAPSIPADSGEGRDEGGGGAAGQ